jgi:hypothetical protein
VLLQHLKPRPVYQRWLPTCCNAEVGRLGPIRDIPADRYLHSFCKIFVCVRRSLRDREAAKQAEERGQRELIVTSVGRRWRQLIP